MTTSRLASWPGRLLLAGAPALLLLALTPIAAAQARGRIDVHGAVLSNTITTGPFAGVPAGVPVEMRLDITVPGFEVQPDKYELYAIDSTTSYVRAGAASIEFKTGRNIGLQDAYPVADGVHLEIMPMSPTYTMECEMWDGTGGHIWDSTDYEVNAGFYGPELFLDIAWGVYGGGEKMLITMHGFTIHPVSTTGTWLLDTPGLPASGAKAPLLTADGAVQAGQPASVALTGAAPAAPSVWVIGVSAARLPLKGGVLVPQPELLILGTATDAAGASALLGSWPLGMPADVEFFFQVWIPDATAPAGYTASNGLHAIAG